MNLEKVEKKIDWDEFKNLVKKHNLIRPDETFLSFWVIIKDEPDFNIDEYSFIVIREEYRNLFFVGQVFHKNKIVYVNRNFYASYGKSSTLGSKYYLDEHLLLSGKEFIELFKQKDLKFKETYKVN